MKLLKYFCRIAVAVLHFSLLSKTVAADFLKIATGNIEGVYLNQTNGRFGYTDLVLHTVGVRNMSDSALTLLGIRIDVLVDDTVSVTRHVWPKQAIDDSRRLMSNPLPVFTGFQLLSKDGVTGFFGQTTKIASSVTLEPEQGLVASGFHFSVKGRPMVLRVTATARTVDGVERRTVSDVPVLPAPRKIRYRSPL